jgi:hypothetical protein
MTNGAIWIAPFGKDFAGEMGFFYSFNVQGNRASRPYREAPVDRRVGGDDANS